MFVSIVQGDSLFNFLDESGKRLEDIDLIIPVTEPAGIYGQAEKTIGDER